MSSQALRPTPSLHLCSEGREICRRENIDLILAVGGGSCIDGSKGIAAATKLEGDVWEEFLKRL